MNLSREKNLSFAKMYERTGEYEKMAEHMEHVVSAAEADLTDDELHTFATAFKNVLDSRRSKWRELVSVEEQQAGITNVAKLTAAEYRKACETELKKYIGRFTSLVTKLLHDYKDQCNDPDHPNSEELQYEVLFRKMRADYQHYLAEIEVEGDEWQRAQQMAYTDYDYGMSHAHALPWSNPIRLGTAVNYTTFLYEIRKNTDEAISVAKKVLKSAKKDLKGKVPCEDTSLMMEMLADNITLWTSG